MAFNSLADFLTMGTHGAFVWSTYGLVLLILASLILNTVQGRRKVIRQLKKRYLRESDS
ncbi:MULTISPECIES: heme exporter protein CcmD [Marinomonas]|jgi:heme exporter protein D|uniref:Heme exporter protein D n=1 Tax=Marinomonas arenicola TaxID=569601 RepID=A0ABU9G757_9GAMM|nr:heme exporter protein CcmD [Marinomonas sp. KMM3893]